MTKSLAKSFPDDAEAKTKHLKEAVGEYLEGLGGVQDGRKLSTAVAVSLKPRPVLSVSQRVSVIEKREREGRPRGGRPRGGIGH
jgi:hypothetical protein